MKHFDAIIIGSGQGGTPLAKKLAKQGWKTALIEKQYVGGTCVNVGCTPTKTMIASAKVAYTITQADELGVVSKGYSVDIEKVLSRKNEIVESFRGGSLKGLKQTENLELIFGTASFSVLQMAMAGGIAWQQIKDMVFAHPLYAEALNNLFMQLDEK